MKRTITETLKRALSAHKKGNLQDAERLYRTILKSEPQHPDANHNLGVLAVSVDKAEAALPLFKTALEANRNIEQYWLSYLHALIKDQQFDYAKTVFEQGRKFGLIGDKVDALETQLKQITQSAPSKLPEERKGHILEQNRNKLTERKKKKEKKQNLKASNPSQQQVNCLIGHFQRGRFTEAEELAKHIAQEFPQYQFVWKVLGAVLSAIGRKSEAVDANQTAVALCPRDAAAHSNLGNALKEVGRLDEARASCMRAIALKPNYAEAYINLGNTLQKLNKSDEALESFNQAIALKPDYAEAYSNLGAVLEELGRLDEALASCTQAIALKPNFAEAYFNQGNTLKALGRLDEALSSYGEAIALKPNFAEARTNLGKTLLMNGQHREGPYGEVVSEAA